MMYGPNPFPNRQGAAAALAETNRKFLFILSNHKNYGNNIETISEILLM
jgi:hypothetical protein